MTYETDETGVESSMPREGFEFVLPTVTYRFTSAVKDIVINGQTYRAGTIERAAYAIATATSEQAIEVTMLASHALPQRYLRGGIPPRRIDVNVYRQQVTSGEHIQIWVGRVSSLALERHLARFRIPARTSEVMQRRIPTITIGRDCPHILYQAGCNLSTLLFSVTRTVLHVDGATVTLSSAPNATNNWAQFGELIHTASGERSTIKTQIGAVIEMHLPIVDIVVGDSVEVRAGCAHDLDTCVDKFANQANYGGAPELPLENPFLPNGYGIIEQV